MWDTWIQLGVFFYRFICMLLLQTSLFLTLIMFLLRLHLNTQATCQCQGAHAYTHFCSLFSTLSWCPGLFLEVLPTGRISLTPWSVCSKAIVHSQSTPTNVLLNPKRKKRKEKEKEKKKDAAAWSKKQEKETNETNKKLQAWFQKKKGKKSWGKPGPISTRTEANALEHAMISRLGTCGGLCWSSGWAHWAGSQSDLT